MRRIIVIGAALLLLFGLQSLSASAAAESAAVSSAAAEDMSELIEFSMNTTAYAPPDADAWVIKYWEKKLNVKIKVVWWEQAQSQQQMNLALAAGEEPDVWPQRGGYGAIGEWIKQDLIAEIPETLLKSRGPDMYKAINDLGAEAWAAAKFGGRIYSLPNLRGHSLFPRPVIWRDDWLKKGGIAKIPETVAEADTAFRYFRNGDPDGNGKKDTYGLSDSGVGIVYGAFGPDRWWWSDRDGKLVYGGVQPEMKDALALLAKWYQEELVDPEFITGESKGGSGSYSHSFLNNRIGFTGKGYYYTWKEPLWNGDYHGANDKEFHAINPTGSFAFGKPLVGPAGRSGVRKDDLAAPLYVFAKRLEKDQKKLGRILQFLNDANAKSPENYLLTYYGQQGVHWEMKNGLPSSIGKYTDVKELAKIGGHTTFYGCFPVDYMWLTYPGYDTWARGKGVGSYTFYTNELRTSLPSGARKSDLDKLQDEVYLAIMTGKSPPDAFDQFVKDWMAEGGEILTKEANEWYATKK